MLKPNGAKRWRLDYTINGNRKTLSWGVYLGMALVIARNKAKDAQDRLAKILKCRHFFRAQTQQLHAAVTYTQQATNNLFVNADVRVYKKPQ